MPRFPSPFPDSSILTPIEEEELCLVSHSQEDITDEDLAEVMRHAELRLAEK